MKLPSPLEIAECLDLTAAGDHSLSIESNELDGDALWAYGTTEEGLRIGFLVTVSAVFKADE